MEKVDISGLDKAEVLFALYNGAHALGMGHLYMHAVTLDSCREAINEKENKYFDYFCGRSMKVDLNGDEFLPHLYDMDNGEGAAAKVIEALRAGKDIEDKTGMPGRFNIEKCQLDPMLLMGMKLGGGIDAENPCARCNMDRKKCGGGPKKDERRF